MFQLSQRLLAICKGWNEESGIEMRGMMGMRGISVVMLEIMVGMMGMQGIRIGMMGMWEIRVGIQGKGVGMRGIRMRIFV